MDLSCIEKIYTIAKRRYNDSLEPLHPCEHPGERGDNDWFKMKCLAEILLEGGKGWTLTNDALFKKLRL